MTNPNFIFASNIPNIIKAYNDKTSVEIYIPETMATLIISFASTRNNNKNINSVNAAINYARARVFIYMSKIRLLTIPQLSVQVPCTSEKSMRLIQQYSNLENLAVYTTDLANN